MRPTDESPPTNDTAPRAPRARASSSPRAHRWCRVDASPSTVVCSACGATLRAWIDIARPFAAARVTRTGPEKCPGRPWSEPAPVRVPPRVCASSSASAWWRWSDVRQTSITPPPSCGVGLDGARGDIAPGGALVSMGWAAVSRADDDAPPVRGRRRVHVAPVCVGRSCAPTCQGVTPC